MEESKGGKEKVEAVPGNEVAAATEDYMHKYYKEPTAQQLGDFMTNEWTPRSINNVEEMADYLRLTNGGREPTAQEINSLMYESGQPLSVDQGYGTGAYLMFFGFLAIAALWMIKRARRMTAEEEGDWFEKDVNDKASAWESLNPSSLWKGKKKEKDEEKKDQEKDHDFDDYMKK